MNRRDALAGLMTGFCSAMTAEGTPVSAEAIRNRAGDPTLFVISLPPDFDDADEAFLTRTKKRFESLFAPDKPPAPVVVCTSGVRISVVPGQIKYYWRERCGEMYEIEYGCQTSAEMMEFFEKRPYRTNRS